MSNRFFQALMKIVERLNRGLEKAIYKLESFRRNLTLRFFQAVRSLERILRALWDIIRICAPIMLTFAPPIFGMLVASTIFRLWTVDYWLFFLMSTLLLLILLFVYFTTDATQSEYKVVQASERISFKTDLGEMPTATKVFGAILVLSFLGIILYVSVGLFFGILLFVLEFIVILILDRYYGITAEQSVKRVRK
jgi:hypothetical protein